MPTPQSLLPHTLLAAVMTALVLISTPQLQPVQAQANNPPVFNTPSATTGSYLFPGFAAVSITFAGAPATDQENDDISYSYRAILPGINSDASLDEALLETIELANGFSFQRKTGYTTQQYIDVYGDHQNYDISLIIRATDTAGGFDELTITITINHVGSPQYLGATTRLNQFESDFDEPVTVYEGQAANLGLSQATIWKQDDEGNELPGQPAKLAAEDAGLQIPWRATNSSQKTWQILPETDSLQYQCRYGDVNITAQKTGTADGSLFTLTAPTTHDEGHVGIRFTDAPTVGLLQAKEYQLVIAATHDFHGTEQNEDMETVLSTPGCNASFLTAKITINDTRPPSPPTGLTGTITNDGSADQLTLNWDAPDNTYLNPKTGERTAFLDSEAYATRVRIEHAPTGSLQLDGANLESPHHLDLPATSLANITGTAGQLYHFALYFENPNNNGHTASNPARLALGFPEPPAQPEPPKVRTVSATSLKAFWKEPHNGYSPVTGYTVEYKKTDQADTEYATVPRTGTETEQQIDNLDEDTEYHVRVAATNAKGAGAASNAGTGATSSQIAGISGPPELYAGKTGTITVTLTQAATATVNIKLAYEGDEAKPHHRHGGT